MRRLFSAIFVLAIAGAGFAQDAKSAKQNPFEFSPGFDIGTDVLPTGALTANGRTLESWTRLGLQPEISFGKIGVGIDLTLRFQLYSDPGDPDKAVTIYQGDWIPDYQGNKKTVLDLYLPRLLFVRYGKKGTDSLFAKLGSIDDLTLGNGFIVGNYSNMHFMPDQRIFGIDAGIDGNLFNFPFLGLEALTGNLSRLDVVGGRLFVRPLAFMDQPILKAIQVGASAVADTAPDLYAPTTTSASTIGVYGGDLVVPLVGGDMFSLAAISDIAFEPNKTMGAMLGLSGRMAVLFSYGAQLRYLESGFIPSYFDSSYDLYRAKKFDAMQLPVSGDPKLGWLATLGSNLIKDKLAFKATLDSPFKTIPAGTVGQQTDYPHLRAVFYLEEGVIGGISFEAIYEKYYIGRTKDFFPDLVDPTDALIGLKINYLTGAALLTLKYDVTYDPAAVGSAPKFKVRSSLTASLKF